MHLGLRSFLFLFLIFFEQLQYCLRLLALNSQTLNKIWIFFFYLIHIFLYVKLAL